MRAIRHPWVGWRYLVQVLLDKSLVRPPPVARYFLSHTMRLFLASVLLVCVTAAPQWDGLKSLTESLSGDDKPGEVNGDYEQVPYEVLAKLNVSDC